MASMYTLRIPEHQNRFDETDWEQWELFLLGTSKECRMISCKFSNSTESFTFYDLWVRDGCLKEVHIDLKERMITFINGTMKEQQFTEYLYLILHSMVIRTNRKRMLFLTSGKNSRQKT